MGKVLTGDDFQKELEKLNDIESSRIVVEFDKTADIDDILNTLKVVDEVKIQLDEETVLRLHHNNRYMIKNSNNIIVSEEEKLKLEKRELVIKDIQSNECQGRTTQKIQEIDRKLENEHKTIKKARKSIK